jgi:hypothetical protein
LPLDPPPLDIQGEVIPHDHTGIKADDGVIRRVSPFHWVYDEKIKGKRLSTMAFRPSSGEGSGMSVDLQSLIEEAGLDPKSYVSSPPWIGAVRFTAGALRAEGLMVGYQPVPDNPYHGEVWGNFSRNIQRRLQVLAIEFVPIKDF